MDSARIERIARVYSQVSDCYVTSLKEHGHSFQPHERFRHALIHLARASGAERSGQHTKAEFYCQMAAMDIKDVERQTL